MSSLSFNNRQVQQWLNAYYFQYLFCSFVYCHNIIHLHIPFWAVLTPKNKIVERKKELMSWQHATIWALIAGNAIFEKNSGWLFRVTHEHQYYASTRTVPITALVKSMVFALTVSEQRKNDAIDFISAQRRACSIINMFTALLLL